MASVQDPPLAPHSIAVFPQRDFVSAEGYSEVDFVKVEVIHSDGVTRSTGDAPATSAGLPGNLVVPQEDPETPEIEGLVEVNHPGGACWAGITPNIIAGDKVRLTVYRAAANPSDPPLVIGVEQTTVAGVTVQRPVQEGTSTVKVRGTAKLAVGGPIPIGQLEQRFVSPQNLFARNNRRTLRATAAAGADGLLAYDPVDAQTNPNGTNWTATYTGLSAQDVERALNSEARILWLGTGAGVEATIYENGAGVTAGPQAPCTAPFEKLPPPPGAEVEPPSRPTGLRSSINLSTVTLNWNPATDNVGVVSYGVYRDGAPIANVAAPATEFFDKNVPAGTYVYTVDAEDAVGNRSPESDGVTAVPTARPAPGGPVSEPPVSPHEIISFPQRDFVSAAGYKDVEQVDVLVMREGRVVSTSTGLIPDAEEGLVEVNHPGGGCWDGNTPDIRPGDIVRLVAYRGGVVVSTEQTTTAGITANRPFATGSTITVTGTAMEANGDPIPLGQLEQRLIAPNQRFDATGHRSL
ncbi:MAG TPA: hypothetical protein VES20_18595, partial [Bryobacteraceae bacterium]|nr:hypothetical protein [Bryobacteraceae bacterium]